MFSYLFFWIDSSSVTKGDQSCFPIAEIAWPSKEFSSSKSPYRSIRSSLLGTLAPETRDVVPSSPFFVYRFDFFNSNESIIQESVRWFGDCLVKTVSEFNNNILNGQYGVGFVDSWFHIGEKYSIHEVHRHPNCSWCGIFYVDPGDINGGGSTMFLSPININFKDISSNSMDGSIGVAPEAGKLILFPSYLQHYQSLYTGDQKRIVVGFNMKILDRV